MRGRRRPPPVRHPGDGQGPRRGAGRGRQVRPRPPSLDDPPGRDPPRTATTPRPRSISAGPTDRALLRKARGRPRSGTSAATRETDDRGHRSGQADPKELPPLLRAGHRPGRPLDGVLRPLQRARWWSTTRSASRTSLAARAGRSGWPPTPTTSSATSSLGPRPQAREAATKGAIPSSGSNWPTPWADDVRVDRHQERPMNSRREGPGEVSRIPDRSTVTDRLSFQWALVERNLRAVE